VVYDVTRPKTFEAVAKWKADLDSKVRLPGGQPIPVVLLANKVQCSHLGEREFKAFLLLLAV